MSNRIYLLHAEGNITYLAAFIGTQEQYVWLKSVEVSYQGKLLTALVVTTTEVVAVAGGTPHCMA